jgi:hypothetical protein
MIAQALEANGAIVYILGRREEVLKQAAATAVSFITTVFDHVFTISIGSLGYPNPLAIHLKQATNLTCRNMATSITSRQM